MPFSSLETLLFFVLCLQNKTKQKNYNVQKKGYTRKAMCVYQNACGDKKNNKEDRGGTASMIMMIDFKVA